MNTQRGFMNVVVGGGIVLVLLVAGLWYYGTYGVPQDIPGDGAMMDEDKMEGDAMMDNGAMNAGDDAMAGGTMLADDGAMVAYGGTVLAGKESKLLEFNQADYDAAVASGKLVFLYFYANWCPTCKAEQPALLGAFNQLSDGNIVGFRVNYKDSDTDLNEEALARKFGVAYQHTKVIVRGGTQVAKFPDQWNQARYITEINAALAAQ